jgi:hypothetical protein
MWLDGICKKCGSIVIETCCTMETEEEFSNDYKNRCTNDACIENKWHYVCDMEELDYYYHDPRIDEKLKPYLDIIVEEYKK